MGRLDLRDPYRDEDFESGIEVVHRQQSEDVSLAASRSSSGGGKGASGRARPSSLPRLGGDVGNPGTGQVLAPPAKGGGSSRDDRDLCPVAPELRPSRFSLKKSARDSGGLRPAKEYPDTALPCRERGGKSLEHRAHAGRAS